MKEFFNISHLFVNIFERTTSHWLSIMAPFVSIEENDEDLEIMNKMGVVSILKLMNSDKHQQMIIPSWAW